MNKAILLLTFLTTSFFSHDIQVATFMIYQESDQVFLAVKIEAQDIANELAVASVEHDPKLIESFLNDQTMFKFNGQRKHLTVKSVEVKEDHLIIQSEFEGVIESIQNVDIQNTCLLSIENHSNIIQLRLNNQERDFLMNSKRTNINVEL